MQRTKPTLFHRASSAGRHTATTRALALTTAALIAGCTANSATTSAPIANSIEVTITGITPEESYPITLELTPDKGEISAHTTLLDLDYEILVSGANNVPEVLISAASGDSLHLVGYPEDEFELTVMVGGASSTMSSTTEIAAFDWAAEGALELAYLLQTVEPILDSNGVRHSREYGLTWGAIGAIIVIVILVIGVVADVCIASKAVCMGPSEFICPADGSVVILQCGCDDDRLCNRCTGTCVDECNVQEEQLEACGYYDEEPVEVAVEAF